MGRCTPSAVSIHAPVKGATERDDRRDVVHCVSIHAPVKGATRGMYEQALGALVSIHAPVKGATLGDVMRVTRVVFQSTRP